MPYKGISTQLLKFLQDNPDRVVTVEELSVNFPQLDRHQIISACSNMVREKGIPVRRVKIGMYQYDTDSSSATLNQNGYREITFTILKETAEKYVLLHENGDIYTATFMG